MAFSLSSAGQYLVFDSSDLSIETMDVVKSDTVGVFFLSLGVLRAPFDIVNIVKYRVIS